MNIKKPVAQKSQIDPLYNKHDKPLHNYTTMEITCNNGYFIKDNICYIDAMICKLTFLKKKSCKYLSRT